MMSLDPRVHKLTILLLIAGSLLTAYLPVIPHGFWTQFAVATQTALGGIVALIKTGQEPPKKDDAKTPPLAGIVFLVGLLLVGCGGSSPPPVVPVACEGAAVKAGVAIAGSTGDAGAFTKAERDALIDELAACLKALP